MTYVLLGEARLGDGLLFVLWSRRGTSVRVLPIGSQDRRDMQVVGRRLMDGATPWRGEDGAFERIVAAVPPHADGEPPRFVALDDGERKAIERSIESELDQCDRDVTMRSLGAVPAQDAD